MCAIEIFNTGNRFARHRCAERREKKLLQRHGSQRLEGSMEKLEDRRSRLFIHLHPDVSIPWEMEEEQKK